MMAWKMMIALGCLMLDVGGEKREGNI